MSERLHKAVEIEKSSGIYDLHYQDEKKISDTGQIVTVDVRVERVNLNDLYNQINNIDKNIAELESEKGRFQQRIDEILKIVG